MFLKCYFVCSRSSKRGAASNGNYEKGQLKPNGGAHWLIFTVLVMGLLFSFSVGVFAQSVLVAGGQINSSVYTHTAEVYNPATGSWTPTANDITYAPPDNVGGLCAPNMALLGNGRVLIAGGGCTDMHQTTNAASLYDPNTNQWVPAPVMSYGRDQFGMVTLNGGNAFAFAGCAGGCEGPNILNQMFSEVGRSAEIYAFSAGQWTTVAQLGTARGNIEQDSQSQSGVKLQDGRLLACNGSDGNLGEYTTCEIYDPVGNTWTPTGPLLATEFGIHQMALLRSGKVLTVSTVDGQSAFLFDPNSGTWGAANSLQSPQFGGQLLLLADGRVLHCGGTLADRVTPVNTAQIYDPNSGTWSTTGPMGTSRFGHIAVSLADGRVLVAGGQTTGSIILSSAETFDPSGGTWSPTTSMSQPRAFANALLLPKAGPFAYVANMNSNTVSVIDIPSSTLANTINVGSGPWGVAISPDQTQVYVANKQGNSVSIIDTQSGTVVGNVSGLSSPLGVAFTPDGSHQAYVVNGSTNNVSVIDTTSQTVVNTVTVQNSPVGVAMAFTSQGTFAYVTNSGSNTVSKIAVGPNPTVVKTINVGANPSGIAATPDSSLVYVENQGTNSVSVISVTDDNVSNITVGNHPSGAAFTPTSTFAYVTNSTDSTVSVIDTKSSVVVSTVSGFSNPSQVALTADGSSAFVTNQNSSSVSVIDTASNTTSGTVTVGSTPIGVAIASAPQTELQITQPLSPTQPNTFTFGTASYVVQYPAGTQFANINMTVKEVEITQAAFQQRIADLPQFAGAACIVYGGTGGNCVDYKVTCSDNNGTVIDCPSEPQPTIDVQTTFTTLQSIVNPGYLTTPIGQDQWNNIFTEYFRNGPFVTVKAKTTGFSEFVAVDLGAPQGQAQIQVVSPQFPVTYSQGQVIPISIQLTSVDPPHNPVKSAQGNISVVMTANANGNPVQQVVFSKVHAFKEQGTSAVYKYKLDATSYAAGTYSVTIYGVAFPSFQGQFTIQAPAKSVVLVAKPTTLTFPNQDVGDPPSAPLRDSLFNEDAGQGLVSSVQTTGDFQIQTNHCANGVKPGTHCDVYVVFAPTALGTRTGTLSYYDNAPDSPQIVNLSGVGTESTTTTLTSSPNASRYGQPVTLTAAVSAVSGTPVGSVTFYDGTTSLGSVALTNGSASLITSALAVGSHSLTAAYSGGGYFDPSTSPALIQKVARSGVANVLTSSQNPSHVGQQVTLSAAVSGSLATPTGTVTFKQGSKILGTVSLVNGQASLTTTFTKTGSFSIVAKYSGDQNYLPKTSKPVKQVVEN